MEYRWWRTVSDINCPPLTFPRVLLEGAIKWSSQADAPWAAIIHTLTHTYRQRYSRRQSHRMTPWGNNSVDISDSQIAACHCEVQKGSGNKLYYQLLLQSHVAVKGPNPVDPFKRAQTVSGDLFLQKHNMRRHNVHDRGQSTVTCSTDHT